MLYTQNNKLRRNSFYKKIIIIYISFLYFWVLSPSVKNWKAYCRRRPWLFFSRVSSDRVGGLDGGRVSSGPVLRALVRWWWGWAQSAQISQVGRSHTRVGGGTSIYHRSWESLFEAINIRLSILVICPKSFVWGFLCFYNCVFFNS